MLRRNSVSREISEISWTKCEELRIYEEVFRYIFSEYGRDIGLYYKWETDDGSERVIVLENFGETVYTSWFAVSGY